ncbi:calcium-binding and coiled-coil domain-containing protein 1 [Gastrophryne carolinensis]
MEDSLQQKACCVHFLNITRSYVSNTKLECHYTLPATMKGSTSDWIGIFKVGSTSIRDYDTFVWAAASASSADGLPSRCTVQFQAYYLPCPGEQQYQFRYVDQYGTVKGTSDPFVFIEPRPMEDLVTLEDEEASLDMILVIPKSTFLQQQLELSQVERNDLMRVILTLEEEVAALKTKSQDLESALEVSDSRHDKLSQQHQDLTNKEQTCREQLDSLKSKEVEHQEHILELEDDAKTMVLHLLEKDKELNIWKTRIDSLEADKEELNRRLSDVTAEMEKAQLQIDSLREKLRCTQDVLSASQQKTVLLGEELATVYCIRDRTISDLHKCRLETAELALKVSDLSLKYEEGMGQWWQEKTALKHSMEAKKDLIANLKAEKLILESNLQEERSQRQKLECKYKQEKDACQVQVSESRRELSELKSALKVVQMEKEQLRQEKQEIMQYVRSLEERLNKFADDKWSDDKMLEEEATPVFNALESPSLPDSGDESFENDRFPLHDDLFASEQISTLQAFPLETQKVVINQPAPLACQLQPLPEDNSDSW